MSTTATATIDLASLADNLLRVRRLCPRSRVMAVVKANAYGHGLIPVARALGAADGFAVARLPEALSLRAAGLTQRILLLGTWLDLQDLVTCSEQQIDVTAHDEYSVTNIIRQAHKTPLRVWLKFDSGMHRVGLTAEEFLRADRTLAAHAGVKDLVHMTHFSSADEPFGQTTDRQWSLFRECHNLSSGAAASLANSAAIIANPMTHCEWVRPGLMLYGENPFGPNHPLRLRPTMTLRTRIIGTRTVEAGESIGYNRRWVAARRTLVGTLGIGYGDGYSRHARSGTPVWVKEMIVPLIGQVSMDSLAVDLTEGPSVAVGDEAVLWGPQLSVSIVATFAGTIAHALLASLTQRVGREYSS